jgi:hypothetical protein
MLGKPILTRQEIAELFRVRGRTIRSGIPEQESDAVGLGRAFRVAGAEREAFVDAHPARAPGKQDDRGPERP